MTPINPFEMVLECPPDNHHPFTYDTHIRVEASYHIGTPRAPDDPDEIRLDKVIRVSDNEDITASLSDDQREAIQVEAVEQVAEAEAIADNRAADGDGDSGDDE